MKYGATRKSSATSRQASSASSDNLLIMIMKMKIGIAKDENEKPDKKMRMNWLCLGGDPKKVANECDENFFARFLRSHKYTELRSLPDQKRAEYPSYSSSSHHYQNLPSHPFTVPCCDSRVPCKMSPKFVAKNSHRAAADVASYGDDIDAYDQPPPPSKQRLHHPQRVRKHSTNGSAVGGAKNHCSCHYVNCEHNRGQAPAAEPVPKMELTTAPISLADSNGLTLPTAEACADLANGSCASVDPCRMETSTSPADNCASRTDNCASSAICQVDNSAVTVANSAVACRAGSLPSPLALRIPPPISIYMLSRVDQRLSESFYNSEDDLRIISESQQKLRLSGWYHSQLEWPEASAKLMHTPVGTFLLRNSSDVNHLYSLSVQTKSGPTSIRIHYAQGQFRLAGSAEEAKQLPKFKCIMQLVEHYADSTRKIPMPCTPDENRDWQNVGGPPSTTSIVLRKPMYVQQPVPKLQHLSRLCVNRITRNQNLVNVVQAPAYVKEYLAEYPFTL